MKKIFVLLTLVLSTSASQALWECRDVTASINYIVVLSDAFDLASVANFNGNSVGGTLQCSPPPPDMMDLGNNPTGRFPLAYCSELYVADAGYSASVISESGNISVDLFGVSFVGSKSLGTLTCTQK